jgi:hypothetical protein
LPETPPSASRDRRIVRWALATPEERLRWLWQPRRFAAQALGAASCSAEGPRREVEPVRAAEPGVER